MEKTQIALFNPLKEPLECEILDDNNQPHTYIIPPIDMAYFEPHIARIMEKRLIDSIINTRELGLNDIYNEEVMNEIKKEIHVEL